MQPDVDQLCCHRLASFRNLLMVVCSAGLIVGTGNIVRAQVPAANKAAMARGTAYLSGEIAKLKTLTDLEGGEVALAAYAMIKGGRRPSDPQVSRVVKHLASRVRASKDGSGGDRSIYAAGCNMMLLEAASKGQGKYTRELQKLVNYVVKEQTGQGFWNYGAGDKYGDTSVTQYGALGFWAAQRAGVKVPPVAWNKAAGWLVGTQQDQGGFTYRPNQPDEGHSPSHSMTVAGAASLLVTQMFLYPNNPVGFVVRKKKKKKKKNVGYVEDLDLNTDSRKTKNPQKKKKVVVNFKPTVSYGKIHGGAARGLNWFAKRFSLASGEWPLYTMYGIERLAALANVRLIAGKDWYALGSAYLLKTQASDGSWDSRGAGKIPGTAFAILFLSKSTAQALGLKSFYGAGVMRSGKGLSDDPFGDKLDENGKPRKKPQVQGSLDVLLQELMKPGKLKVKGLPKAIVEKIKLGNKENWLNPKRRKQLLRMLNHPRPNVRRVAVWALGRTADTDIAGLIVKILEDDPDLDVAVEARIALCWISRKPTGFGLARSPIQNLSLTATKKQKTETINNWRSEAKKRWRKWYFTIRPYDERDDLSERKNKSAR